MKSTCQKVNEPLLRASTGTQQQQEALLKALHLFFQGKQSQTPKRAQLLVLLKNIAQNPEINLPPELKHLLLKECAPLAVEDEARLITHSVFTYIESYPNEPKHLSYLKEIVRDIESKKRGWQLRRKLLLISAESCIYNINEENKLKSNRKGLKHSKITIRNFPDLHKIIDKIIRQDRIKQYNPETIQLDPFQCGLGKISETEEREESPKTSSLEDLTNLVDSLYEKHSDDPVTLIAP
jgi:hypothetical protein